MIKLFELEELEQLHNQNPDTIIFAYLAAKYVELGMIDKARSLVEKGLRRFPYHAYAYYVLGQCHYQDKNYSRAKSALEKSLSLDEKNPSGWKLMAEIDDTLKSPESAQKGRLNYFLMDPFNKDAVDTLEQQEAREFSQFESDNAFDVSEELGIDNSVTNAPEEVVNEEESVVEEDTRTGIDELFSEDTDFDEELNISQKVEEVFKETLGDMNIETDFDDKSFDNSITNEIEKPDLTGDQSLFSEDKLNEMTQEVLNEENTEVDQSFFAEQDDTDISVELNNLFSEFEESNRQESVMDDDSRLDRTNTQEPLNGFVDDTNTYNNEETENDFTDTTRDDEYNNARDDDFLDFSNLVEDVIAESNDQSQTASLDDTNNLEQEDLTSDITRTNYNQSSSGNTTARFGRPPILSPTLGEIYIAQGRFEEAIEVFEQLLEKDPQNQRFKKKITDIRNMMSRQGQG